MDNRLLSEQFRIVAKNWVKADAAARLLEDSKSAVLARLICEQENVPHNRAETNVKAGEQWQTYITDTVNARTDALTLKVQLEYIRMQHSEQQSHEATKRSEMRL